ncbi:DUF262 domain-containing protein [Neisseria sp. CCUG12390]|uniref:DUF262 domain-containing protein n=1 Tax=Neisseria sp. CCUG12390 TaxID=3392035 RepID=UPI003A0FBA05
MEAGKRSINELFNGNRTLNVPFFQRSYVWKEEQWERFLSDMEMVSEQKQPYFLGSVILKQQLTESNSKSGDTRILIDGQQRLTTLNIFFKVLYLKLNQNNKFNRLFRIDNNDESLALQHNYNDINAFETVMKLEQETQLVSSGNNIYATYEYFRQKIDIEKLDDQSIKDCIMFVGIDLGSNDDEQQIFDTINSLGVRLTTAELLKNYFFNGNNRKNIEEETRKFQIFWKDIFECEDSKDFWDKTLTVGRSYRTVIDLFFHSYLQIKIQEAELQVSPKDKMIFSRTDNVFSSYKKLIEGYLINKDKILQEIKEYANLFIKNFDFDIVEKSLPKNNSIERINLIIFGLEQSTLIPYILYILKNVSDLNQRNELFGIIENYIVRRIIVKATAKNYNRFFSEQLINNRINSKEKFINYLSKIDNINHMPNNTQLETAFNNSVLTNLQARGVLYLLESSIREESRQTTQLLGLKKYSLEHLMPKKWKNFWGIPENKDPSKRDQILLTLGNLTIITQPLNTSIRNASWEIKKHGKDNNGLNKYAASIETLQDFLSLETWDETTIENRAKYLYQKAIETWNFHS